MKYKIGDKVLIVDIIDSNNMSEIDPNGWWSDVQTTKGKLSEVVDINEDDACPYHVLVTGDDNYSFNTWYEERELSHPTKLHKAL